MVTRTGLHILGDPGAVSRAGLKGATKVFKHGRMCLKTFVAPFLPARLTAPGSPRIRITRQWHFTYNYSLCTILDKKRPKVYTFALLGLFSAWNTIFGVQSKYLHKWYVLVWQINNVLERAILSFLFVTNPPL